jgi:hypothetical protein
MEPEHDDGILDALVAALAAAVQAAITALLALLLAALTLLARALQAIFTLARPGLLAGSVAAAGYSSVTLFASVLALYGDDLQAGLLALSAVVLAPATLLILAGDYGAWAICLAVAGVEILARLLLEHAPPAALALLPVAALAGCVVYFLMGGGEDTAKDEHPEIEKESPNVE